MREGLVNLSTKVYENAGQDWSGRLEWQAHVLRIAIPVYRWFLSRPENLTFVGLLLLKDCVFDVDPFPYFGRSSIVRDVSGEDVVVGWGRGIFIKRNSNTGERNNLDYG